jgi:hypothetical protein
LRCSVELGLRTGTGTGTGADISIGASTDTDAHIGISTNIRRGGGHLSALLVRRLLIVRCCLDSVGARVFVAVTR